MVVLASSFLDSSLLSLAHQLGQHRNNIPLQALTPSSSLAFNSTEEQPTRKQSHSRSSPSSWIPFFFFGSSQKSKMKPLIEEMGAAAEGNDPFSSHEKPNLSVDAKSSPSHGREPIEVSVKKPARVARRVVFTPQKAQELRKKLKGSDSFHDFMYHSAIASRLATHDS